MPWTKADQLYRSAIACFGGKSGFKRARNQTVLYGSSTRASTWRFYSFSSIFLRQFHASAALEKAARLETVSNARRAAFLIHSWKSWKQRRHLFLLHSPEAKFCYWKPAFFVGLGNHKGQMIVRWMAFTLGSAPFLFKGAAMAEEANGGMKWPFGSLYDHPPPTGLSLSHTDLQLKKATFRQKTVEAVLLFFRTLYLFALFTPALVLSMFAADKPDSRLRAAWLYVLLRTLEYAGPAFIKWGQWAATRPDMFPADICQQLSKLHSQAPAHTFYETRKIIEKAFHLPLDRLFEEFSEKPIASGSIAQVHKAVLRTKGQKPLVVAVKVRHPRVSTVIQRDFVIMNWLARMSTKFSSLEHLQLDKTVQQFATFMTKQVDLTLEAAHLMRFIYNFRQWRNVSFPRPIYPLVHPEVLVETFEEGRSIQDFIDEGPRTKLHSQLARLGSSLLLKMLLSDNFIHGDLHPGNMFVKLGKKVPQLILLDVGMTAELSQRNRYILLELFKALSDKDGARVARCALEFSEDQTCTNPEAFVGDVDNTFKQYLSVRGTSKMGDYIAELFEQVRRYRVNLDGEVCTVMVTVVILEGWQRKLDMSLDIMRMVKELLFKAEWTASFEYVMGAIAAP
ncbi:ABC1 family protein YPL109C, mitochondrial isoform X1 [Selaginella moellendorffii]|nr:ABC1 family protein YPL109C, mitochondrial isoform X1 [Selaginella moellendorffii]|eukprot:XP_024526696.1 ABC1 family protein YPL109C, mitochondrial isoform X1 [Selaginella moellendorffii]